MSTRKIIDAKHNGEKVWLKGHAQAIFMSDGTTVEDAINNIEIGAGGENNCKSPFAHGTGTNSAVIDSDTYCEATGASSFAMGIHAKAIGEASVAMGRYAKAEGRASVALGGLMNSIYVTGEANATEYIATNIKGAYVEDVTLLIGYDILEYKTDNNRAYLAKITNAEPTDTYDTVRITVDKSLSEEPVSNMRVVLHYCRAVKNNSIVLGSGGAHAQFSTAIGFSVAANDYATAMGYGTIAAGVRTFASGYYTKAEGANSHTEGYKTHAIGLHSHAEGTYTRAVGSCSHAEGASAYNIYFTGDGTNNTYLIQYGSNWQCVEDLSKLIDGEIIDLSNYNTVATIQSYSLADDGYTLAVTLDKSLGVLDKARFGIILNIASGDRSHTQNGGTRASGKNATSMGSHTIASGESSLATGDRTFATGTNSSTHGENTHALNKNEAAFGVSNISHNGEGLDAQTLFSIGCGDNLSGIDMASRIEQRIPFPKMEDGKNAVEVMRNGDIWYGGYNTGVKIWDARLRKSPYLIDPNGTKQQVVLGDGSLKALSAIEGSMNISGTVNLTNGTFNTQNNTSLNSYTKVFENMSVGEMRMYLVSDSNGKLPSTSETAVTVPHDGVLSPAKLYFGKSQAFGVSVGDICVLLKKSSLINVCRIIPLNDVKPSNGDFPGADGLATVWDKNRINKIDGIEWTANHVRDNYLPKNDRFPSRTDWLINVNYCVDNGVYPTCDAASMQVGLVNNYVTLIVHRTSTVDNGGFDTVEQTAYGRGADEGKIYKRIIFYNGSSTEYGDWKRIDNESSAIEIKYTLTESEYGNHDIVDLYNIVQAISARMYNNGWLYNEDKSYDVVVKGWTDNSYNGITYANFNVRLLTTRDGHSLGMSGYVDVAQIAQTNEDADCPLWVGYICGKYLIENDGMAFHAPENPNFIAEI